MEASGLARLTGGATMESWRFACDREDYVLRRAPSLEFMEGRPTVTTAKRRRRIRRRGDGT